MDVSAMISALQDHGFNDASTARLVEKLNTAYWDICSREPWPFLQSTATLTFPGTTTGLATNWPADYRAATILVTTAGDSPGTRLRYMRYDDFLSAYGNALTATGTPRYFYFTAPGSAGQFVSGHFYPSPPATCQVTMGYIAVPPALASNTLEASVMIPPQFHSVIVDGALFKLYAMEDDTDIAPTFETYFERGIQNMREALWRQDYSTQDTVGVTDMDDIGLDTFGLGA